MEDLPLEIEEKIEQLPILPFEINEEFQELMFSDLFSDIFNFYKENYLPDTLKTKSEIFSIFVRQYSASLFVVYGPTRTR